MNVHLDTCVIIVLKLKGKEESFCKIKGQIYHLKRYIYTCIIIM